MKQYCVALVFGSFGHCLDGLSVTLQAGTSSRSFLEQLHPVEASSPQAARGVGPVTQEQQESLGCFFSFPVVEF